MSVRRGAAAALLASLVACGSRSDLTPFGLDSPDAATGNAGVAGRGGAGGAGLSGDRGDVGGRGGAGAGGGTGGGPVATAGAGSLDDPGDPAPIDPSPVDPGASDGSAAPLCDARPFSLDRSLRALVDDLSRLSADEAPFTRYVSVGYRRTIDCEEGEQAARSGQADLALLLNLTSASSVITVPTPVPSAQNALLRIDLRQLGWARQFVVDGATYSDGWEAIAAQSPLALELRGSEADVLRIGLSTSYPLLSFSDLLSRSTQGELYYELVDMPDTFAELAARMGVPLDEPAGAGWLRGNTTASRISRQQRGAARYRGGSTDAPLFWLALDYAPETALPGVFLDPLTLQADSRAALFTLPNGFLGFFAAGRDGLRLAESPLMMDANQPDFVARNAVSCMSCHAGGPIGVSDEVRAFVATNPGGRFDADDIDAVDAAYPTADVFAQ
ncbi:MAG TPA: hypothetical protein VMG12_01530, partial [Polyangiaceae bacterium]|nr:hypothetical protein [Polyangiaceae bacterium]